MKGRLSVTRSEGSDVFMTMAIMGESADDHGKKSADDHGKESADDTKEESGNC
mgnify:CR=1 FL=1